MCVANNGSLTPVFLFEKHWAGVADRHLVGDPATSWMPGGFYFSDSQVDFDWEYHAATASFFFIPPSDVNQALQ